MNDLPTGVEPLVLADGTKINPVNGEVVPVNFVKVPTNTELQEKEVAVRRKLADLPTVPAELHTISVLLSYELLGVDDSEASIATGLPVEDILAVRKSDVYDKVKLELVDSIIKTDLEFVRGMFVQRSVDAANKIIGLIDSENELTAMSASKDVLDRAGHRPADVVEHRHRMEGGLTITYVERKKPIPVIDVTPERTE